MSSGKNNGLKIGAIIVLVLATVSFVFLPAVRGMNDRQEELVFGSWDGVKIKRTQDSVFNHQINFMANAAEQYGLAPRDANAQKSFTFNLFYGAYRASVLQIAMQQEAHNAGFIPSPDAVNKDLLAYFSDANGVYSPTRFEQTSDMKKAQLRKDVREQLEVTRYIDDFFGIEQNGFGLKMSDAEAKVLRTIAQNEKKFNYVVFTDELYPPSKIVKYGKEHKDLFASYNLRMITCTSEQEAKNTLAQLKKNELSFDDAVATVSTKKGTDELGVVTASYRYDINALIPDATQLKTVLEAKPDAEPTQVVKTSFGWAIIKSTAEVEAADFDKEATIKAATRYVKSRERGMVEDYLVKHAEQFKSKLNGRSLSTAAANTASLHVKTSAPFSVNYGNSALLTKIPTDKDPIIGRLMNDADFFTSVFALKTNEVSKPILADGDVILFEAIENPIVDEAVLTGLESAYKDGLKGWHGAYPITSFLFGQSVPFGQQSVFDFVFDNDKFDDHFFEVFSRLQ